ncbi:MAG TPA: hypothetical protein VLU92_03005 [Candidatus Dormibacteraeota bacterium]|nr:hypothetical protein [Candidatus Dormibacteraeota bacterium]
MDTTGWEERNRALIARLAGVCGLVFVAFAFAPGSMGGPLFDNISSQQIVDWVSHNGAGISFSGFTSGLAASVVTIFLILLVRITAGRGALAVIGVSSAASFMAIDWVHAGVFYAMADAGQRGQSEAGVVALFSLAKMITFADGFVIGMAVLAISVLAMLSRTLPRPIVWLGFLMGGYHIVETPIQLALNGRASGVTGPVDVLISLIWVGAVALVLLIKPIWVVEMRPSVAAAS